MCIGFCVWVCSWCSWHVCRELRAFSPSTIVFRNQTQVVGFSRQMPFPTELFASPAILPLSLKDSSDGTSPPVGSAVGVDPREKWCASSGTEVLSVLAGVWRHLGVDQRKGTVLNTLGYFDGSVQALYCHSLQHNQVVWSSWGICFWTSFFREKVNFGKDLGRFWRLML